jgi:hypothetical protein
MPARRKKVDWSVGDVFHIPLADGDVVLAQIVGRGGPLNSVTIAMFDVKCKPSDAANAASFIEASRAFAVLFVTRDLLDIGVWPILGPKPIAIPDSFHPYEHLREIRFVGAKVIGSAIINEFANAYYGLAPWDDWKDPRYLDGLLLSSAKKPRSRLVYKSK